MTATPSHRTSGADELGALRPRSAERRSRPHVRSRARSAAALAAAVTLAAAVMSTGADAAAPVRHHNPKGRSLAYVEARRATSLKDTWMTLSRRRGHGNPTTSTTLPGLSPDPTTTLPPTTTTLPPTTTTTIATSGSFPVGTSDASEPSGMAPPSADALAGYTQSYVSDFGGSALPGGWSVFTGKPGSDPGAQWAGSHVTVDSGMLQLNTWQDPAYGNEWVAGGLCQCGVGHTYGSYFVRSRVTGAGPTGVQLLWPVAHVWPPEIDFNETDGTVASTSATVHWGSANSQDQRRSSINMTQWHTWGVIWSPASILYTVDGRVWGSVTNSGEVPSQAMTLDLTQQTWCSSGWACPSAPQSMQVDWVAEYIPQ